MRHLGLAIGLSAVLLLNAGSPVIAAQTVSGVAIASEVSIPNSYRRTITSTANGVTYHLSIFLPKGYDPKSPERYPVFYFVPGDTFGIYIAQMAKFLSSGDIPKIIIVGIEFSSDDDYFKDLPTAGPDPHWTVPEERGAEKFLGIVTHEIKPYVDANFPTDPSDTGIGGHSLGGFFALYAMLHDPATFRHVFASSPSLVWQNFILLREEAARARRAKDLPVRVFVDQGALEGDDGRLATLNKAIESRHYPSLRWESRRTSGQTHQTVAFADGIDALYHIYGPDLRQPSTEELAALSGQWKMSDGSMFRLVAEHGRLFVLNFRREPGNETTEVKIELLSKERDKWFTRYLWDRISIRQGPNGSMAMQIRPQNTPGPSGVIKAPVLTAERTGS